jgi:hypothetical protein
MQRSSHGAVDLKDHVCVLLFSLHHSIKHAPNVAQYYINIIGCSVYSHE